MTADEATEIIRRVEANSLSIIDPDARLGYAVLMQAWAKPLGLTLVNDGWWRLMGLKERYNLPLVMPFDRKSKFAFTLWAWRGQPVCYVSFIYSPPSIDDWKDMEAFCRKYPLQFAIFDRPCWSRPDHSAFVVWEEQHDWRSIISKMKDVPRMPRPPEPEFDDRLFVQKD
jgi:hypothetical protein